MNFDELRRAIEAMPHSPLCAIVGGYATPCNCKRGEALAALDTLEREHAKTRALLQSCLEPVEDARQFYFDANHVSQSVELYQLLADIRAWLAEEEEEGSAEFNPRWREETAEENSPD